MDFSLNASPSVIVTLVFAIVAVSLTRFFVRAYFNHRLDSAYEASMVVDERDGMYEEIEEKVYELHQRLDRIADELAERGDSQ